MERHFFASSELRDLELLEMELENMGVVRPQIHVLTDSEAQLSGYRLHEVSSLMRTDVIRKGLMGAVVGAVGCFLVLAIASISGLPASFGWTPFILLAIVVLGFCTWEAGFLGFQLPNRRFLNFERLLKEGKHIFFVDVRGTQRELLDQAVGSHPGLVRLGEGQGAPWWLISLREKFQRFVHWAP
ncbi:MAG: hypothetical protein AMXMBFR26_12680 [Porticoccaceae bacterium]